MSWIDPGEFGRGAAAREDARADRERAVLDQLLGAGWNRGNAAEARRLHDAMRDAVGRWLNGRAPSPCNDTAIGLVGEARGAAMAEWWADAKGLDDDARRLLIDCAGAAAAMAMLDGYLLGRASVETQPGTPAVPAHTLTTRVDRSRPADSARVNGARAVAGVA